MRILCIVPLPPPVTGAAAVSQTVVNALSREHEVHVIQYQRGNLISGEFSVGQSLRIFAVCGKVLAVRLLGKIDRVYLVMSSSFWGNVRDQLIYATLGERIRRELVVHLHGGTIDRLLERIPTPLQGLNRRFLGDVRTAIVLGPHFKDMFRGYIAGEKIRILPNYFDSELLLSETAVAGKFVSPDPLRILYLSNMIPEKGYRILLDAFLLLPQMLRRRAELHFVGTFKYLTDQYKFCRVIEPHPNIRYHGHRAGDDKKALFAAAHVFCLPTSFMFEGQPISILEAYASGCIVLTTSIAGINDIFKDGINGLSLGDASVSARIIRDRLAEIIEDPESYRQIALNNRNEAAANYRIDRFMDDIRRIVGGTTDA